MKMNYVKATSIAASAGKFMAVLFGIGALFLGHPMLLLIAAFVITFFCGFLAGFLRVAGFFTGGFLVDVFLEAGFFMVCFFVGSFPFCFICLDQEY